MKRRFQSLAVLLAATIVGCGKSDDPSASPEQTAGSAGSAADSSLDVSDPPADPNAAGYDAEARAEALRRDVGFFFIEENDTLLDLRVFEPHERRVYTVEGIEDHIQNVFMYVDSPPDLNNKVGYENGGVKVASIECLQDEFHNKAIGNYRVSPTLSGDPPWEVAVENLTDERLLFQIVQFARGMTEAEKAQQAEMQPIIERNRKEKKYREAIEAWRANPEGDAPKKEDFGL